MTYTGQMYEHWVNNTLKGSIYVILEDGSLWEISTPDRLKPSSWLKTDVITVVENISYKYPYKLVNHSSGDAVEAKYLGKLVK